MWNEKTTCYDQPRLEGFLHEQLGEREEAAIQSHLDHCDGCRARLAGLVANRQEWEDLPWHFAGDLLDPAAGGSDRTSPSRRAQRDDGTLGLGVDREFELDMNQIRERLGPTDDPAMVGRLGRYEVIGLIGRGSTGVVLKALDPGLNRYVAIKMLAPSYLANGSARRRFEREGRAVAAVSHEYVVPVYEVEEYRGVPYIVMQYVPGNSLQRRIELEGPLETREVVRIGMQIARGLAAAHAQGIVHRDVKPANVLLESRAGRAMVTDFGLARVLDEAAMTRSGLIAGTPQYMSPEQASGESVDPRSDLFSLGSVLYTASTGRVPFRSDTVFGVLKKLCESEALPVREIQPEIDEWLAAFIAKLHAKEIDQRFESAADVADILERELAHLQNPGFVPPPPRPWLVEQSRGRKKIAALAAVAVAVVTTVAVGASGWIGGLGFGGFDGTSHRGAGGGAGEEGAAYASMIPEYRPPGGGEKKPFVIPPGAERPDGREGSQEVPVVDAPADGVELRAGEPDERCDAAEPDIVECGPDALGVAGEFVSVHRDYPGGVIDGYQLYLPRSYGTEPGRRYPLILSLTGGCGVGCGIDNLSEWVLPNAIEIRRTKKIRTRSDELLLDTFIVASPHMIAGSYEERQFYFQEDAIEQIVHELIDTYHLDPDRVYLTGAGRGGHGTWGLASRMPELFAAIAPIRGLTDGIEDWNRITSLPIWVAHMIDDEELDIDLVTAAVERIESLAGEKFLRIDTLDASQYDISARRIFTTAPPKKDAVWPDLYQRPELFEWFLQFKRESPPQTD